MNKLNLLAITLMLVCLSCSKDDEPIQQTQANPNGYNMLLMGNSFFIPYASTFRAMAIDAGFENHNGTTFFRGGHTGRAINFWNDSTSEEHLQIKATLDKGDVDILGMTYGHEADNPTEGYSAWIEYALRNNPNTTVFISIPPPDFPANWGQLAQGLGFNSIQETYTNFINENAHDLTDQLRAQFPSTNIFTIPTGWAAITLAQMKIDNELLDNITLFGSSINSVFTDDKGHQGQIVLRTGGLIWLNSIYNVDLSTYNYEIGFNTDLHGIAIQITDNHDPNYRQ